MLFKPTILSAFIFGLAMTSDGATAAENPQVALETSMGRIVVELYPDKAPKSVENFLQYVADGHYSETVFHRVIGSFMIQGGGFGADFYKGDMSPKTTRAPIEIESRNGLKNDTGWLAMARTSDPNSATAQFFINTVDNDGLNYPSPDGHGYAVFGKVIEGMDVVKKIAATKTTTLGPMRDVPEEPITINSAAPVAK
jgi:peptidyl-prolyl cis-trans isomerase A (cyclophilin A)